MSSSLHERLSADPDSFFNLADAGYVGRRQTVNSGLPRPSSAWGGISLFMAESHNLEFLSGMCLASTLSFTQKKADFLLSVHVSSGKTHVDTGRLEAPTMREDALALLHIPLDFLFHYSLSPNLFLLFSCLQALNITLADERSKSEVDSEAFTKQNF